MKVTRSEQIHIDYDKNISHLCHISKNLYNEALYHTRQIYFHNIKNPNDKQSMPTYNKLDKLFKKSDNYKQLYSTTSNLILKKLIDSWKSYFEGIKEYKIHPNKFLGRPKPPNYKKKDGEFILIFENRACNINSYENLMKWNNGNNKLVKQINKKYKHNNPNDTFLLFPNKHCHISPIKTKLPLNTNLREVRIIPQGVGYNVEIVYDKEINNNSIVELDKSRIIGIDLGLSNTATISNNINEKPIVIKGGTLKSINQFYNKRRAEIQSIYNRQPIACRLSDHKLLCRTTGTKIKKLTHDRNNKIKDILHKYSRYIINYCIKHNIGTIVIGVNPEWKQKIQLGKINNQNFVTIPFYIFRKQLSYKAEELNINIVEQNESHTSKCSFLDNESIEHHDTYAGKRIKRGLFRSSKNILINADVQGAYNIIKKAIPNAFANGIEDVGLHPIRVNPLFCKITGDNIL